MRIAMIGPFGLHPNKTMRSRAMNLARRLVHNNNEVAIFMPPWQTPLETDRWWSEDGVTLRYTKLGSYALTTSRNLIYDVLAWQPNVIHGFKPKAYSGLAMWWFWHFYRRRMRLVLDLDDWEGAGGWNDLAPYTAVQKRFFAWQEQWGIEHAHAVTAASRTLESLTWSKGIPVSDVFYIPNGSGLAMAGMPFPRENIDALRAELGLGDRPALLIYSRFFEFDTSRLAAVLEQIMSAIPDLAILLIGQSLYADDAKELKEQLSKRGVLPAVVDLGWIDEEELPLLLRAADAALYLMNDSLINRSKCPVKLADLAAAGVPVIAENVGQVSEYVVNGCTGFLLPSGDVPGLSSAAISLLLNREQRASFGCAARNHYKDNFAWDRLVENLVAAYQPPAAPKPG